MMRALVIVAGVLYVAAWVLIVIAWVQLEKMKAGRCGGTRDHGDDPA